MAHTTISRRLGPREQAGGQRAGPLFTGSGAGHAGADQDADAAGAPRAGTGQAAEREPDDAVPDSEVPGQGRDNTRDEWPGPLIREGVIESRYAGAMLLHAFLARADAGTVLSAGCSRRDSALLTAVSVCFALGQATIEQLSTGRRRRGAAGGARDAAGAADLRPKLAAIADSADLSRCRPRSRRRCWPRNRWSRGCITSMTFRPMQARSRSARAGTTSAAARREAARTHTSRARRQCGVLSVRGAVGLSVTLRKHWRS